jgi:hypothetical protein
MPQIHGDGNAAKARWLIVSSLKELPVALLLAFPSYGTATLMLMEFLP